MKDRVNSKINLAKCSSGNQFIFTFNCLWVFWMGGVLHKSYFKIIFLPYHRVLDYLLYYFTNTGFALFFGRFFFFFFFWVNLLLFCGSFNSYYKNIYF